MKSGVYKIVNIVNGKLYVGSSTNVKYRLWRHTHELRRNVHENKYLQNAWNKHGEACFSFIVLLYYKKEKLLEKEQKMINHYKSTWQHNGYNICSIAGNCLGITRSEKTRSKMRGNTNAKGTKGFKHSLETRMKMSQAKIGKSAGMSRKFHSEETKKRMANAKKGKVSPKKGKTYKKF